MDSNKDFQSISFTSQIDSVEFSAATNLIVAACSKLSGNTWTGELIVVSHEHNKPTEKRKWLTQSGNSCAVWLGAKDELIASCNDEGQVQIWSITKQKQADKPLKIMVEHDDVVTSLSVNGFDKETLLSASWDMSIKLLPPRSPNSSQTFFGHTGLIWDVEWNHKAKDIFASGSQDGTIKVWDQRQRECTSTFQPSQVQSTVYSLSWSYFNEYSLACGSEDSIFRIFDTRNSSKPTFESVTHKGPIKKVKQSPHVENVIAITCTDGKVLFYNTSSNVLLRKFEEHKDYVRGIGWSSTTKGLVSSGSWDKTLCSYVVTL